ncbi:hypothetical protein [Parasphingorhabdus sp.]|uniref:hypothetical protein n=1 Tax=Parasphingorhabdus sp. TaxID=2709688 RepID=UPI0030015480
MTKERETENDEEGKPGYLAYDTPVDIIRDDTLDQEQKRTLLESWKMDLDSRLYAESEGMSSSEPISASQEAHLAEQESLLSQIIELLDPPQ